MRKFSDLSTISIQHWCLFCNTPVKGIIYKVKGLQYACECHKCYNRGK